MTSPNLDVYLPRFKWMKQWAAEEADREYAAKGETSRWHWLLQLVVIMESEIRHERD